MLLLFITLVTKHRHACCCTHLGSVVGMEARAAAIILNCLGAGNLPCTHRDTRHRVHAIGHVRHEARQRLRAPQLCISSPR